MTLREITMTTEIKVLSTQDAFCENDLLLLDRNAYPEDVCLGVMCWETSRTSSSDPIAEVLSFVISQTSEQLVGHEFWLLIGNSTWQPDTRIVRYRKIFNSLSFRGVDLSVLAERSESSIEHDGKIKFFGAGRFDASLAGTVASAIKEEDCSYLVVLPRQTGLLFPLSTGWSGDLFRDQPLIESVIGRGGVILRRTGYFDDPEIGLLALGNPTVLAKIAN
jgi:hypothetical protein